MSTRGTPTPMSAYVLTKNSARYLPEILPALKAVSDEVLVVDSGSTDDTCRIAEAAGARVLFHPFESFRQQREFAASECNHDYIFFCDSDEIPDERLQQSICDARARGLTAAAYAVSRRWFIRGVEVHAIYPVPCPDSVPRLFDRRRCHWDPAKSVHETLLADGPQEQLKGALSHYTFHTREEQERKLQGYTDLAAEQIAQKLQKRGTFSMGRRISLEFKAWISSPLGAFFKSYLSRGGWRDGGVGLSLLNYAVRYSSLRYRKAIKLLAA